LRSSTKTVITMLVVIMMVSSSLACGYWQSIAMAEGLENTESEEEPVLGPFEFADMSEEEDEPEQGLSEGDVILPPEEPIDGGLLNEDEGLSEGDPPVLEELGNEELPPDAPTVEEPLAEDDPASGGEPSSEDLPEEPSDVVTEELVPEDVPASSGDPSPQEPVQPDIIEPPAEPVVVSLAVEHVLEWEGGQEVFNAEVVEGLSVGTQVYGKDYAISDETVAFIRSEPETLILVEAEEQNVLRLYYSIVDVNPYVPEAPDFPLGEEMEAESPPIQEFEPGSLGPFELESMGILRKSIGMRSLTVYDDETGNKTWPEPGSLNLAKTGEAVPGTGNQWELTLTVEGKNYTQTSDIVLVIDRSGSMSGAKIANAKIAAKAFVNNLLSDPNDTSVRIAIVSFASDVRIDSEFRGYAGKSQLISAIDGDGMSAGGGTHIQAGIKQATVLLDGSTATYKTLVLLGDGAATYSYKINNPIDYTEYWKTQGSWEHWRTTSAVPQNQFNYSSTVGNGSQEISQFQIDWSNNRIYYYRHGASAVAEAGFAKAKGYAIYSIALSAGDEGEWTLENIADAGNYYETPDPSSLEAIFLEIAGRIRYAARNAVVTDPIGDMYYIPGITAATASSFVEVSDGTVSYNEGTRTLTWSIGTIVEGKTYWMKYTVTMKDEAEPGTLYPTNGPTSIDYTNIDDQSAKKYFQPIPEYRIRGVTFTKVLDDPNYADKEFSIELEGAGSKKWHLSLEPGESQIIKGLPAGTYTVREIVPMNFALVGMTGDQVTGPDANGSYQMVIQDSDWNLGVSIENERSNDGWFWDDDEVINTFHVTGGGGQSASAFLFATLQYFTVPEPLGAKPRFDDTCA